MYNCPLTGTDARGLPLVVLGVDGRVCEFEASRIHHIYNNKYGTSLTVHVRFKIIGRDSGVKFSVKSENKIKLAK